MTGRLHGSLGADDCGALHHLERLWGDQKYRNNSLDDWLKRTKATYSVNDQRRPAGSVGYVRKFTWRWVVERTLAWIEQCRRHSRDYEHFTHSSEAMIKVSSIHRMLRYLKPSSSTRPAPFKYRESREIVTG